MKIINLIKRNLLGFIVGAIIFGSIGAYALTVASKDVTYNNTNVESAINDLYSRVNNSGTINKKFCEYKDGTYGTKGNIGSMYECDPGDGVKRNFYILAVNNDNTVDMIMQHNLTEGTSTTTMTWNNAMKYIDNNNLKTTWSNVLDVDLPKAQDIANAVGRNTWYAADNSAWWCLETKKRDTTSSPYCYNNDGNLETLWLWDYTRECASWNCEHSLATPEAYGYWTRDLVSDTAYAWRVYRHGSLNNDAVSGSAIHGVRPVITVLKSNLY